MCLHQREMPLIVTGFARGQGAMSYSSKRLVFATRPSALARHQTQTVMRQLQAIYPGLSCEERLITTQGDKILHLPLPEIGGKGLFTRELEAELLSGRVHCAVHSLKDLPVDDTPGLTLGCIPARADARDVLVSAKKYTLEILPFGAEVGTSSLRRAAQLLAARPDLKISSLRGNVDTRLRKALEGKVDAILLAGAGLIRLGLDDQVTHWLPMGVILPAPGQGALAVQCRADDRATRELLASLEDDHTRLAVTAERTFLRGLGGGCSAPIAAYATVNQDLAPLIHLQGRILTLGGEKVLDVSGVSTDAAELGLSLARQALSQGAAEVLSMAGTG